MFTRHRRPERPAASGAHRYVAPPDSRIGLALGGADQIEAPSAMTSLVTATSVGRDWCAAPGCGKHRDDRIHWPPDDGWPTEAPSAGE